MSWSSRPRDMQPKSFQVGVVWHSAPGAPSTPSNINQVMLDFVACPIFQYRCQLGFAEVPIVLDGLGAISAVALGQCWQSLCFCLWCAKNPNMFEPVHPLVHCVFVVSRLSGFYALVRFFGLITSYICFFHDQHLFLCFLHWG